LLPKKEASEGHSRAPSLFSEDSVDIHEVDGASSRKPFDPAIPEEEEVKNSNSSPSRPALSRPVSSGDNANDSPEKELENLMTSAAAGDAYSQYCLGYCFDSGELVGAVDTEKAIHWYTRAAEHGHGEAINNLGVLYITGHGGRVEIDTGNGLKWFLVGANLGNRECQFHTALCYLQNANFLESGLNEKSMTTLVEQLQEALKYFKAAADQGHIPALVNVAVLILEMHQHLQKLKLMRQSSSPTNSQKQRNLTEKIPYTEAEAIAMMEKAATEHEDPLALHNMGVIFKFGLFGVKANQELYKSNVRKAMTGKNKGIIAKSLSRMKRDDGTLMSYSFS
jgi:TPR repeat protein